MLRSTIIPLVMILADIASGMTIFIYIDAIYKLCKKGKWQHNKASNMVVTRDHNISGNWKT